MSNSIGLTPSPTDSAPCGSKSTSSTRRPYSASAAPRLMVDVVLPTPPFWLHIAMIFAGPCSVSGEGIGKYGSGRPVGPTRSRRWRAAARANAAAYPGRGLHPGCAGGDRGQRVRVLGVGLVLGVEVVELTVRQLGVDQAGLDRLEGGVVED